MSKKHVYMTSCLKNMYFMSSCLKNMCFMSSCLKNMCFMSIEQETSLSSRQLLLR